jgi:NAD(P)-dependent dehydrogenase (short-subunit alcohol dehydrogenase family)
MNLKNKRVLITGSSSGIGQATAIEFAKKGAIVFINYKENEKGAMETLNEVKNI